VPEITVDEYGYQCIAKNEIWFATQIRAIAVELQIPYSQLFVHQEFDRGVSTLDARHDLAAFFGAHYVPAVTSRYLAASWCPAPVASFSGRNHLSPRTGIGIDPLTSTAHVQLSTRCRPRLSAGTPA
jgi:hypothetical protein